MARATVHRGGERAAGERSLVYTLSGAHALIHAIELAYAALLLRIEAEFGANLLLLGVFANIAAFTFGLGALPAGVLVDRLGSMRVLRLTLAGSALAALLVAASPSELTLGVTLALLGITTGLYHPAGFALLARTSRRTRDVAMHGVVGSLGIAVAPVLLSGIALATDWRLSSSRWARSRRWASSTRCGCGAVGRRRRRPASREPPAAGARRRRPNPPRPLRRRRIAADPPPRRRRRCGGSGGCPWPWSIS